MEIKANLILGDCKEELKKLEENSIDLIATSPPYADQRKNTYGGIHPNNYVEWFLPISKELLRALKPSGTFILNIKERVFNGERHTYVLELILALRNQGWLWTEEFMWCKKNSYPGKWPNRFRDSWERLLQFNKTKRFKMFQEAVMVPMGDWARIRLRNLSVTDKIRDESKVGSGFGKNVSNWLGRDEVYPTNVLHMATECNNKKHSAVFPESLPEWFIRLFTEELDWVLDPFMGSGATIKASQKLRRNSIGIEIKKDYYNFVSSEIQPDMNSIETSDVTKYVKNNIGSFHTKRLQNLEKLKLNQVLKRKNPYLFKARNILTAHDLVKTLLDAYLSSQEETIFGDFLEGLAIFINGRVYNGKKSSAEGIDLEFEKNGIRYIVSIKSGPNWGNSRQINKLKDDFKKAKRILRTTNSNLQIVAVNGCCYGRDNKPDKGDYYKYCGQKFWEFISGNEYLYVEIIEPFGHRAKEKNEVFSEAYSKIINKFTLEFSQKYCIDGRIDWDALVKFNSSIAKPKRVKIKK